MNDRGLFTVMAVDPGDVHQGVFVFGVDDDRAIHVLNVFEASQGTLYSMVESMRLDALVIESYLFYPWQARNQGFSEFVTVQTIGALKYIAERRDISVSMQKATIKKKARSLAQAQGVPMATRALGSGKSAYRGPDFDAKWLKKEFGCPSSQHVRDAMAHGYWWAWTNSGSPARLDNY